MEMARDGRSSSSSNIPMLYDTQFDAMAKVGVNVERCN